MILTVPNDDGIQFPTLGPQVVEWMENYLVFGPGDMLGEPLVLSGEMQAFIWRFYEHFPKDHPKAGRRRFDRCALSLRKGRAKTELLSFVSIAELHPDAPVRFNGWHRGDELAPAQGVKDPVIPLVATSGEQSSELAYGKAMEILRESVLARDFDIGLARIKRVSGKGKCVPVTSSPNARDGALITFQGFDETHRMDSVRMRQVHHTMLANAPKRKIADAWTMETTTAYQPGAGSVAEGTMEYARAVADGRIKDASLFFFHQQASEKHNLTTKKGLRAAIIEASGKDAAEWSDLDKIASQFSVPDADKIYLRRVWLNQIVKGGSQAFDAQKWMALAKPREVKPGELVVLGLDGAQFHDAVALTATALEDGYQFNLGLWECPPGSNKKNDSNSPEWKAPFKAIDEAVRGAFEKFDVWRMYADPPYLQAWIAKWIADFGEERVIEWFTARRKQMASALENYETAIKEGTLSHDGHEGTYRHIGNSRRIDMPEKDEDGRKLWLIAKERRDSPNKIDAAMTSVLSWEAYLDAVAAGATKKPEFQMMVFGRK